MRVFDCQIDQATAQAEIRIWRDRRVMNELIAIEAIESVGGADPSIATMIDSGREDVIVAQSIA